jgi:acetyl esterase/lipase
MSRLPRIGILGLVLASWLVPASEVPAADTPAKARQTAFEPHKSIRKQKYGRGARSYWIFEPGSPTPAAAPVVVFHHGWLAVNPAAYGAWIDHLVRRGNIVIYPRYQSDPTTDPGEFLSNALAAVKDALDVLETSPDHVRPDRQRFALVGHSAGGNLSAQMAAVADENHLPSPRAIVALMPGEVKAVRGPNLAEIPATALLVVAAAEDDRVVGDVRAREIFAGASSIPEDRKKYILYRTDLHGSPRLVAHHFSPTAILREFDTGDGLLRNVQLKLADLNAFDWAGFWRVADITLEAAFTGKSLDEATGRGELFRHLGYWSDGRVVERPIVGDDLSTIPRVFPTNGLRLIRWTARDDIFDSIVNK